MMRTIRALLFQNARTIPLLAMIATLAMACGGGDSEKPLLRLNEQEVSADNYRAFLRASFQKDPSTAQASCRQIESLTPAGIVSMIDGLGGSKMQPVAGSTPKPGQKEDRADAEKAAAIFKEECARR